MIFLQNISVSLFFCVKGDKLPDTIECIQLNLLKYCYYYNMLCLVLY